MINKKKILFCCLCTWQIGAFAQSGIVASGGNASGSNGSLTYSIGQIDFQTLTFLTGEVAQGLQHPYESNTITVVDENSMLVSPFVYPNPTADRVTLNFNSVPPHNTIYKLFDSRGRVLSRETISKTEMTIPMESYPAGIYFIRIMTGEKETRNIKIIKSN